MKPLTREQQDEAVRLVRTLVQKIERYSESHATGYKTTPQHRLHDSIALADITTQAKEWSRDLDYENVVVGMEYQRNVIEALTKGRYQTRDIREVPVLDEEEEEEMRMAFEIGTPWAEFAETLHNRDIGKAEAVSDPYPSDFAGFADNH